MFLEIYIFRNNSLRNIFFVEMWDHKSDNKQ